MKPSLRRDLSDTGAARQRHGEDRYRGDDRLKSGGGSVRSRNGLLLIAIERFLAVHEHHRAAREGETDESHRKEPGDELAVCAAGHVRLHSRTWPILAACRSDAGYPVHAHHPISKRMTTVLVAPAWGAHGAVSRPNKARSHNPGRKREGSVEGPANAGPVVVLAPHAFKAFAMTIRHGKRALKIETREVGDGW